MASQIDKQRAALYAGQSNTGGGKRAVQFMSGETAEFIVKLLPKEGQSPIPVNEDEVVVWWLSYEEYSPWKKDVGMQCLINVVVLNSTVEGAADTKNIKYLKVPPSVVDLILTQLEQWDLLDTESEVVKIVKGKVKGKTQYSVIPQRKTKFNAYGLPYPETTMEDAANKLYDMSMEKNNQDYTPRSTNGEELF